MNKNVLRLQRQLNQLGYGLHTALKEDGIWGPKTQWAVQQAQRELGLVVDGIPGPNTRTALTQALKPSLSNARREPDKSGIHNAPNPVAQVKAVGGVPLHTISIPFTSRFIDEIIMHCFATPEGKPYTLRDVRAWHKARGFTDVGYHFLILLDGTIETGRPLGQIGAHVADHNTGSIGISYCGGLTRDGSRAKDTRTDAQKQSELWLVTQLTTMFPKIKRISGHNQFAAKACPSYAVESDPVGNVPGFVRGRKL